MQSCSSPLDRWWSWLAWPSIERWRLAAALDSARKLVMEAILETQAFYWLKRVTDIDVSKTQSRLSRS
jgi:hypothetical protein